MLIEVVMCMYVYIDDMSDHKYLNATHVCQHLSLIIWDHEFHS